ncbi:type II toxin-antitoxin system HipA family toxin [Marinobacter sp. AN1]|uniref:type II toxin-antitoxin system HipA family toxin n=1 Tax=Marinobacter sp. AN1 TaxID=2886046 RepID=UPI00222F7792|nr:HipA domain-containing protein [Marinobacter sp. AN1]UZD64653.1 HipA domain-containing protein [Marinobacter sp. AN1]
MSVVELERWGPAGWDTLAGIIIDRPESGLLSPMRLDYQRQDGWTCVPLAGVTLGLEDFQEDDFVPVISLPFVQWASPQVPGDVLETYEGEAVAALLRDLIPSGWARRRLLKRLRSPRWQDGTIQDGPQHDVRLLKEGALSPIGNFRIKGPSVDDGLFPSIPLDVERAGDWYWPYEPFNEALGLSDIHPIWAGLGAGGENPKLLINRADDGQFYLDGNEPDSCMITDYWLVKWPREPISRNRIDILRAEYLYLKALGSLGFDVPEVRWQPDALWVRRFDRGPGGERYPVESLYNVMGKIGNGARLSHIDALEVILPLASDPDGMLVEYLIRDHINRLLGNSDNHGRNTSFHRTFHGLELTPIYDVSPMVMDEDGIAWSATWPRDWQKGGNPDWQSVIQRFAHSPDRAWAGLQSRSAALTELQRTDAWQALPKSVTRHPRVLPIGVPISL